MKKRLLCLLLSASLLFLARDVSAQTGNVTGRVIDSIGQPLADVTVKVKSTSTTTKTDATGTYRIAASQGDVLQFSSVGYELLELSVQAGASPEVQLKQTIGNLNEIVVIGYGTSRKKDLTGAVSTINSKDFNRGAISTPEQMIAGKVAGVAITSNSGQPGAGSTIRIRGGSSLSASNDPLIVIDGVPLDNSSIPGASNQLSLINPNDIESFTILKDASAAAIYGTRASNGVMLITTKKGTAGKVRVNASTVNSVSIVTRKVDVLSADQFRAIVNAQGSPAQIAMLGAASTNWQDEIYRSAFATDNNVSISGGLAKLPYRLSIGYQNQDGVLKTDNLQRTSLALVLNPSFFNNHLKVDVNLKGNMQQSRFANQTAIGSAITFDPTQPVFSKGNRFGGYYEWLDPSSATGLMALAGRNPVGLLEQRFDEGRPRRAIGNIQLDYKFHFLPELRANLNAGMDLSEGKGTVYVSDSAAIGYVAGGNGGENNRYRQKKQNTLFEFYLNYTKELSSIRSRIDATAGYSYNNYLNTVYNFASYTARGDKYPNTDPAFAFDKPENTLISYFGRLNYNFMDRYLLTATVRRDGSSRFAPANRWAVFPSVALAWNIKEESFLRNNKAVSNLKLRLGYGVTGQQDGIGNYDYLSYYALSSITAAYQFGNDYFQGFRPGGFYANRKWEETATTNLALDFGFLDDRITGSIDVYYKKTNDLLNNIPQPAGTNFAAFIVANVGDMENRGVEFNLNTKPVVTKDLEWNAGFNVTFNRNKITNLTVVPKDLTYPGFPSGSIAGGIGGQFAYINAVGGSRNVFYLYEQVYDASGKPVEGVFVDRNADGIINQDDLYKGKNSIPEVFMGFSTSVSYKKWSASTTLRASLGNYVYNNVYSQTGTRSQILGNSVLYNTSINFLETGFVGNSQQLLSDYYIENASFLRMDNLSVGYELRQGFRHYNMRISATAQNLFVVTKYKGLDPELAGGIDNNFYPRPKIFSLGLNVSL
ncbi:MAG: TonB-dependent receptor [Chitinophagaceae bacterium]|nr:MAG: TonB-dependent receptor [Chitinophagaceae bacterium]